MLVIYQVFMDTRCELMVMVKVSLGLFCLVQKNK